MKRTQDMTVEELVQRFKNISRQRISVLFSKFLENGDLETVKKIKEAKRLLKKQKRDEKTGCDSDAKEYALTRWTSMVDRCGKAPGYVDCSVGFTSFDQFFQWSLKQTGFLEEGFELDKDILVKGNRVYSEETCAFVPLEINSAFVKHKNRRGKYPIGVAFNKGSNRFVAQGAFGEGLRYLGSFQTPEEAFVKYKEEKEKHIKLLAEKWKDKIDPRVYEALINYQVEITD